MTPRGKRSRSCDRREEDEKRLQPAKTAAADSGHFSSQVRFSPVMVGNGVRATGRGLITLG